ncbi:rCG24468 [Rattus norvegicus]|uniref:RCG24468 n=1 Tax=Rattus norvegicus TaxID=10116 RepID=A6KJA3_RAT|nr:rCG24468 [Rattus norvegicus]
MAVTSSVSRCSLCLGDGIKLCLPPQGGQ